MFGKSRVDGCDQIYYDAFRALLDLITANHIKSPHDTLRMISYSLDKVFI